MHVLQHAQVFHSQGLSMVVRTVCVSLSRSVFSCIFLMWLTQPMRFHVGYTLSDIFFSTLSSILKTPFLKACFSSFKACHYFMRSFSG